MKSDFNYYRIVWPLLHTLGFQGDRRTVIDAIPHLLKSLNIEELRQLMSHLGYESYTQKLSLRALPSYPGLFITKNNIYLVTHGDHQEIYLTDVESKEQFTLDRSHRQKGMFYYFCEQKPELPHGKTWLQRILERFKSQARHLLVIGLFNALFALTLPMFIRSVFDWAIPAKSFETLHYLVAGLGIALFFGHIIHVYQNKSLAYMGARLSMIISSSVITKILKMPYAYVEGASVPEQISRIKQFEGVKDVFTSPMAQLVLEGPFMLFFIIVLGIIGGPLVVIPIILIACFIILAAVIFPAIRNHTRMHSTMHNKKIAFLLEIFTRINTVKYLGREKIFANRFEEAAYGTSKTAEDNDIVSAYATNISQILIKIAGLVTILWGAVRVMHGDMTMGSLVAVVLLIWRALSPMQMMFMFLSQFDLTLSTIRQINQLMALPNENYAPAHVKRPKLKGYVLCNNVSFRYPNAAPLALRSISMEALPGEIVAIMGDNASGKSTLLKLILGFYKPTAGHIMLDHYDTSHMSVNHVRQSIACVPQQTHFFHGTIEQNLLLSNPTASHDDVIQACKRALVWDDIESMPEGLNTKLTDRSVSVLNSGLQQKLSLARAYLRNSSILVLDEPGSNLDMEGDEWLKKTLLSWHGEKTTLIVTHRPSVVRLSDRLLVLEEGAMKYFGPTHKVLELMNEGKRA